MNMAGGGHDATMSGKSSHKPKKNGATPNSQDTATRKQHQPLSAISIQDLNSVQVRWRSGVTKKFKYKENLAAAPHGHPEGTEALPDARPQLEHAVPHLRHGHIP